MAGKALSIRAMHQNEIEQITLEWAAREGWNPGLADAAAFHAADPGAFLVGELDGDPVACISAVDYGPFGFLGFYIVRSDFRGQGCGIQLWNAGMERLAGRNIGLDGVIAQQDNYKRSGFMLAYRNIRFEWRTPQPVSAPVFGGRIVGAEMLPFEDLAAFDRKCFPAPRTAFLERWLALPHGSALATLNDRNQLAGYGVIRACRTGFKIGPLFAEEPAIAEALFLTLARHAGAGPLYLDIPEPNKAAIELVRKYGMERVFETARMYTREAPALPLDKIFGVTTFELG